MVSVAVIACSVVFSLGSHGYNHPVYGGRELLRFIRSGFDRAVVGISSRDRHGLGIVRRSERKRRRVELGNLRFSGCITILFDRYGNRAKHLTLVGHT